MSTELTGIVLCGGESRRMGADKGLLPWGSIGAPAERTAGAPAPLTWAGHAAALLEAVGLPWYISVRTAQVPAYGALFGDRLVIDDGEAPGPLGGLLSAHRALPNADLLLLACDMTEVDEKLLWELMRVYRTEPAANFIVYREGDFAEPFPGIYKARGMSMAPSLQALLRQGPTAYLPIVRPEAFINRNTP